MYWFIIPYIPFSLSLNYVLGYVHSDFSVDHPCTAMVKFRRRFHNLDFVAEKSCPASVGVRYQRLFC